MKALIYKEFKLAMHPICYLFICLFPFMILIPSYPITIGFIYVLCSYPILFLGANKGQQSNDLLYSVLLPVRKKDIVLARIITIIAMQVIFFLIMSALWPVAYSIQKGMTNADGTPVGIPGLGLTAYVSIMGIVLAGYGIADLIFLPIYYKKGKSIVLSTLLSVLVFVLYVMSLTVIFPYLPGFGGYTKFLSGNIGIQFLVLLGGIVVHILLHLLAYKISAKRLDKVDF